MNRAHRKAWPALVAVLFALGLNGPSHAAPINSNTAFSPHRGESILRLQGRFFEAGGDSSPMDRKLRVGGVTAVYVYGFTQKITGTVVAPYLDKSMRLTTASGQRITRGANGLADIRTLLKYRVYTKDTPSQTHRLGLFGGLEWPTGNDNARDSLGTLPQPLQLGSGSWDPLAGIVWTTQKSGWELDADLVYKINTKGNKFEFGDQILSNISYQYRLLPRELPEEGVPSFFYGVIELNASYADKNKLGGVDDNNSGGFALYLSPGIQWASTSWIVEAGVQIPIVQNLNGNALEADYAATLGMRYRF